MKPQDKAEKGLALLKESILDYLEKKKTGVPNSEISSELRLKLDLRKFTRTPSWWLLQLLEHEGRIRSEGKGHARVYFLVKGKPGGVGV